MSRRKEQLLLLVLLLLSFALRVYRLQAHEIWGDEAYSVTIAGWPLHRVVSGNVDTHPPLYYVLLFFVLRVAGRTPFAIRSLSAAAGMLVLPLLYRLGKGLGGRGTGLWTAAVGAISPFLVYYSQEARMYVVGLLGATGSLVTFVLIDRKQRGGQTSPLALWGLYGLSSLIAVYSHYYAFAVLLAEALFVIGTAVKGRSVRHLGPWLLSWIAMALCFAPWALEHRKFLQGRAGGRFAEWTLAKFGEIAGHTLVAYGVGTTVAASERWWSWGVVALALLGLGWMLARHKGREALLLTLVIAVGLFFAWTVNPLMPFFAERYLLVCAPAFLALVGAGLTALGRAWRPAAILGAVFVLLASGQSVQHYYFDPAYAKSRYGRMMAEISSRAQDGDVLLLNNPLQASLFDYYRPEGIPSELLPRSALLTDDGTDRMLQQVTEGYRRAWLVEFGYPQEYDPEQRARTWLGLHGSHGLYQSYPGARLFLFVLGTADQVRHPLTVNLGGEVSLEGYSLERTMLHPGDHLLVTLYWQGTRPIPRSYTVFVHLLDENAQLLAQMDNQPVGGTRPTTTWEPGELISDSYALVLSEDAIPGTYDLKVGMYLWPEMTRLPVLDGNGEVVGDQVLLATVEVR